MLQKQHSASPTVNAGATLHFRYAAHIVTQRLQGRFGIFLIRTSQPHARGVSRSLSGMSPIRTIPLLRRSLCCCFPTGEKTAVMLIVVHGTGNCQVHFCKFAGWLFSFFTGWLPARPLPAFPGSMPHWPDWWRADRLPPVLRHPSDTDYKVAPPSSHLQKSAQSEPLPEAVLRMPVEKAGFSGLYRWEASQNQYLRMLIKNRRNRMNFSAHLYSPRIN